MERSSDSSTSSSSSFQAWDDWANKGSLTNWIGFGESKAKADGAKVSYRWTTLGMGSKEAQEVINNFKKALTEKYGESIATQALQAFEIEIKALPPKRHTVQNILKEAAKLHQNQQKIETAALPEKLAVAEKKVAALITLKEEIDQKIEELERASSKIGSSETTETASTTHPCDSWITSLKEQQNLAENVKKASTGLLQEMNEQAAAIQTANDPTQLEAFEKNFQTVSERINQVGHNILEVLEKKPTPLASLDEKSNLDLYKVAFQGKQESYQAMRDAEKEFQKQCSFLDQEADQAKKESQQALENQATLRTARGLPAAVARSSPQLKTILKQIEKELLLKKITLLYATAPGIIEKKKAFYLSLLSERATLFPENKAQYTKQQAAAEKASDDLITKNFSLSEEEIKALSNESTIALKGKLQKLLGALERFEIGGTDPEENTIQGLRELTTYSPWERLELDCAMETLPASLEPFSHNEEATKLQQLLKREWYDFQYQEALLPTLAPQRLLGTQDALRQLLQEYESTIENNKTPQQEIQKKGRIVSPSSSKELTNRETLLPILKKAIILYDQLYQSKTVHRALLPKGTLSWENTTTSLLDEIIRLSNSPNKLSTQDGVLVSLPEAGSSTPSSDPYLYDPVSQRKAFQVAQLLLFRFAGREGVQRFQRRIATDLVYNPDSTHSPIGLTPQKLKEALPSITSTATSLYLQSPKELLGLLATRKENAQDPYANYIIRAEGIFNPFDKLNLDEKRISGPLKTAEERSQYQKETAAAGVLLAEQALTRSLDQVSSALSEKLTPAQRGIIQNETERIKTDFEKQFSAPGKIAFQQFGDFYQQEMQRLEQKLQTDANLKSNELYNMLSSYFLQGSF